MLSSSFRRFIERAPSAQALLDRDLRIVAYSPAWAAAYGLDPDGDHTGRACGDVLPARAEAWGALLAQHLDGTADTPTPACSGDPDGDPDGDPGGRRRRLRDEVRPWHTEDGEIGGLALHTVDLAETAQAAHDRTLSAALLAAARKAEAAIWAFDADRRQTLNVGAPLRALGQDEGWNVGARIDDVYADLPAVVDGVTRVLEGTRQTWSVRVHGRTFETVASPMTDDDGAVVGGVGISIDVTDREGARAEAERQARRLRRLHEATSATGGLRERAEVMLLELLDLLGLETGLLSQIDPDQDRYEVLAAAPAGVPIAAGDTFALGTTYCALTVRAGDVVAIGDVPASEAAGHPAHEAFGLEAYIGAPVHVMGEPFGTISLSATGARAEPFTASDRDLVRLAAQWMGGLVEADHRERRLFETADALAAARDEAETANRAKSAFLASMSHEIRTPMHAVVGFSDMLATTALDPAQRRSLQAIQRASARLLGLIDEVLDFSRVESGRLELHEEPVGLADLVRSTLEEVIPIAEEQGNMLTFSIEPGVPPYVAADRKRLQQVLANLVANAVKFTEDGEVAVAVQRGAGDDEEEGLVIEVSDTGVGIPADRLESVFETFVQGDGSITRAYGGTGLGLAIARRFVELMGGEIEVESVEDEGSTFRVRLPLHAARAPGLSARVLPLRPSGGVDPADTLPAALGLRVLLVEDLPDNQSLALQMFYRLGYVPDVAADGLEALDLLRAHDYDLVFMDVMMPRLDGLEATRRLRRELPPERQPRVVALTARALESDRVACLEAGMDDVLTKPLRLDTLAAALMVTVG